MFLPGPRGFADPSRIAERRALLSNATASRPLQEWADTYALARGVDVPRFDPAEAGVDAHVLFILEAPGPMTNDTNARPGSRFVSVDNDDLTAANMWKARAATGLHSGVLHWNIVPWYLGVSSRKPRKDELAEGGRTLLEVMNLLPHLQVVVLCGRFAQRGWDRYVGPHLRTPVKVRSTWHPSPLALHTATRRADFTGTLSDVAEMLRASSSGAAFHHQGATGGPRDAGAVARTHEARRTQ